MSAPANGGVIRMRMELSVALPAPAWPGGIARPAFEPSDHGAPARALLNHAYARGEGDVAPFGDWWESLSSDGEYDPALCFVAWDAAAGALAGFAQCWTSGFVKDVAVAGAWRGRGLGRALMAAVFEAFRARGLVRVDLKVRAANTGARAFYRALGMVEISG